VFQEKPHKCALCSKSFPTPGDLKSHMYVHSGSWPYKCDVCNRGFSKQANLKNHLLLHTGMLITQAYIYIYIYIYIRERERESVMSNCYILMTQVSRTLFTKCPPRHEVNPAPNVRVIYATLSKCVNYLVTTCTHSFVAVPNL